MASPHGQAVDPQVRSECGPGQFNRPLSKLNALSQTLERIDLVVLGRPLTADGYRLRHPSGLLHE